MKSKLLLKEHFKKQQDASKPTSPAQQDEILVEVPVEIPKEKYILRERRQQIIDELRLL